ncbi:PTS glucitol/sorbitol transporter subunit IIA [Lacticaseibacillus brantae]|nr:PTS glucitol/sorbitol transporter subunit IIA [Lacticaseibacillus brantae]
MTVTATISAIGPQALSPDDPMVILFDDSATEALRAVTLIQDFQARTALETINLSIGDTIDIDNQEFTLTYVGQLANENLHAIGHVALVFAPVPEHDRLENALYLTPTQVPDFHVDTRITY